MEHSGDGTMVGVYGCLPMGKVDLQLFDYDSINMPCKAGHIVHGKWTMFTIPVQVTVLLELRLLAMLAEPSSTAVFRGSVCASTLALSTVGISGDGHWLYLDNAQSIEWLWY